MMPIPPYDVLMLPMLRLSAEKVWSMRELVARIADDLKLTSEERERQIPSGGVTVIASRVGWAKTYLKQAGLVEQPRRGTVAILPRGREVLKANPSKIDSTLLQQFLEFPSFLGKAKPGDGLPVTPAGVAITGAVPAGTPEEQIAAASRTLDEALRDALLARILEGSPSFFERVIIDLLLAMGYGGSRTNAGEHIGGTGDGGVDGLIREDQLGLDRIYLQAKRYHPGNTVGSEAVQAFIGALVGKSAHKGVFITTSNFSAAARNAASQSGSLRLVLIDGAALMELLLRFNVGVRVAQAVEIKKIDIDYFEGGEID